jgi:hypothetical protein
MGMGHRLRRTTWKKAGEWEGSSADFAACVFQQVTIQELRLGLGSTRCQADGLRTPGGDYFGFREVRLRIRFFDCRGSSAGRATD